MDSNKTEYEQQLLSNPKKLVQHLSDHIEEIEETLNDDENFCNQDIDSTITYVETIEKKFNEKIQILKDKLEHIRLENKKTSEQNKKQFQDKCTEINELFTSQNYEQAWNEFKNYEKNFEQRSKVILHIPKFHMKESDIEEFFSSDYKINKPTISSTTIIQTPVTITDNDQQDFNNINEPTKKERLRQQKIIEKDIVGKNDDDMEEFDNSNKVDHDRSNFGIRSKRPGTQPTTTTTTNNNTMYD
ncbi:unnamed protein product [Rotaria sp. Silwood2]|nr:unnamed protein product [Rotaria sp. Silwood2]CAF4017276.1 unnamed protein product [Rotaria sp. Silwood2]